MTIESLETTVQILFTDMAHWNHPEMMWKTPAMFQQSRKFAAMRSSRAISGGIGNSGISVDELVYLVFFNMLYRNNTFQCPLITFLPHLVLYVKYMQTFCKTWLGISLKFTWKKI